MVLARLIKLRKKGIEEFTQLMRGSKVGILRWYDGIMMLSRHEERVCWQTLSSEFDNH